MTERRLLLAGSVGPERIPSRPNAENADWFLPLHLRDERAAIDRIAAQVEAGADVVVAPTWLTHRRALLPLGETRRAAAWSAAAVRVARDGVELGLERREASLAAAEADDVRRGRPLPLVAASLPALDDDPEPGTGRLLPREAATERDYRDQAGLLSDAQPDLLLVEGQRTEDGARVAMTEAVDTGLPVWTALTADAIALSGTEAWLDWGVGIGAARLLLPPPLEDRLAARAASLRWGAVLRRPDAVASWLDAGAGTIASLDGASPRNLAAFRQAVDELEREEVEQAHAADRRWRELVGQAASMAPGGAAAWVGQAPDAPLPAGFAWTVVDQTQLRRLPADHYRFVVTVDDPGSDAARLLQRGGILVGPPQHSSALRLLIIDEQLPPLAIHRRDV